MAKMRLDQRMVLLGLATTRARAQAMIRSGQVFVNGKGQSKSGTMLLEQDRITLVESDHPYVSRGGLKLKAALTHWGITTQNAVCADIGSSTGGFSDCLLQHGASRIFAIDVGSDQMVERLRRDKRIVLWEQLHVKDLTSTHIPELLDLVVIDVSFISLKQVIPHVIPFLKTSGHIVALLKPQFELGPTSLNARGIVKDGKKYRPLLEEIYQMFRENGFQNVQSIESPILGGQGKGNREFLIYGERE